MDNLLLFYMDFVKVKTAGSTGGLHCPYKVFYRSTLVSVLNYPTYTPLFQAAVKAFYSHLHSRWFIFIIA